ncbi:MAG: arsenate reductase family protein [Pseudomonadota bacterium]
MAFVIYHNPDCSISRNVVRYAQEAHANPIVIEYLKDWWTQAQLLGLFAAADVTPVEALRRTRSPAEELGLLNETDPEILINAMVEHPILVNRPFVCTSKGVKLCRPAETVFEVLQLPTGQNFLKEDGDLAYKS